MQKSILLAAIQKEIHRHEEKLGGGGMGVVFSIRSGTDSLSQSMERVPGIGQLAVAALLKDATASSVLSNTSNTVTSFVIRTTSFA